MLTTFDVLWLHIERCEKCSASVPDLCVEGLKLQAQAWKETAERIAPIPTADGAKS